MDLINKYKMLTYALVLGIIFAVSSAGAADFTNSSSGTINNKGTLRIKGDRKFRNAADYENIINEGTFEFTGNGKFTDAPEDINNDDENGSTALGKDATWRVPGITLWSSATAQDLQPRWYEDLSTSNDGVKEFNDGSFYVSGVYEPVGGGRDYGTSNFYYDGTESQDIVGENGASGGNNVYYNLVMQNAGVKTIQDGQTANVENNVQIESSSTSLFTIAGILNSGNTLTQEAGAGNINISAATSELNLGAGASEFNGGVDVAGSLTTVGEGLATFNGGIDVTTTGSFNLVAGDAVIAETSTLALGDNALINVSADRTLTVTGAFTNADNDQSNLTFDIASNVIYDNSSIAQNIIVTSANNPFGNLSISGESKTPLGDIFMAGDFSLADKNLSMG
ncbi:MAG: hypothetical protein RBT61_05320, partial [Candidatus Kapabacteria bacterium]|nr:hypothetical protein [Candidatus Kapabacteria bacterium]